MTVADSPDDPDRDALQWHDLSGCRWWHHPEGIKHLPVRFTPQSPRL